MFPCGLPFEVVFFVFLDMGPSILCFSLFMIGKVSSSSFSIVVVGSNFKNSL